MKFLCMGLNKRPLQMSLDEFENDCMEGIKVIKEFFHLFYRAACFSLDRELNILKDIIGVQYDSRIGFDSYPSMGQLICPVLKKICHYVYGKFSRI